MKKNKTKEEMQLIGKWLITQRKQRGLTQQKLSDITGLSKPTLLLMDKASGNYSIETLGLYLTAMELSIKDLSQAL